MPSRHSVHTVAGNPFDGIAPHGQQLVELRGERGAFHEDDRTRKSSV